MPNQALNIKILGQSPNDSSNLIKFFEAVHGFKTSITLTIKADNQGVHYFLSTKSQQNLKSLQSLLQAADFNLSLTELALSKTIQGKKLGLRLKSGSKIEISQPLPYLLQQINHLNKDKVFVYSLKIKPRNPKNLIFKSTSFILDRFAPLPSQTPLNYFKTQLTVTVLPGGPSQIKLLKANLALFEPLKIKTNFVFTPQFYASSSTLSQLYCLPSFKNSDLLNFPKTFNKQLPPPPQFYSKPGLNKVPLGINYYQGVKTPLYLDQSIRRRHQFIIGGTGVGKTTLLKSQIIADIQSGQGVAVIDPHGDLAQELLDFIPEERQTDLIYFNPLDLESVLGIDLLKLNRDLEPRQLAQEKDLVTENMVSMLRKVFLTDEREAGHRLEYILRNTIQTALSIKTPAPNLLTLFRLLNDPKYNQLVVSKLNHYYLKLFWKQELGKAGDMQRVKLQAGITAKLGRFIFSPIIKAIFTQTGKHCLDFKKILDQKQILICNFAKGSLGEDTARLLSSAILTKLQLAALQRVKEKPESRSDFYIYVDEFQNFASRNFIEMLSESRKYGLNLVMAEQSCAQQDLNLTNIILANVATVICFRTHSNLDTQILSPLFEPLITPFDLSYLDLYNFYVRFNDLEAQPPTSAKTILIPNSSVTNSVKININWYKNDSSARIH